MNDIINKTLAELEKTAESYWNVSRETGKFLNLLIKLQGSKNILELGTSNGYSGIWIGMAAKQTGANVTTIEYFEERIELAKENFRKCDLSDIITIKQGKILDLLDEFNEKFDFVFIDANKSEYISYFKMLNHLLKKGGLIVADNIDSHYDELKDYVEYSSAHSEYQTVRLPLGTGLLLNYKQ